jgi:hypothetical protein
MGLRKKWILGLKVTGDTGQLPTTRNENGKYNRRLEYETPPFSHKISSLDDRPLSRRQMTTRQPGLG